MLGIRPVAAMLPRPRKRLEGQGPPLLLHGQELVLREFRDNRLVALKDQLLPARSTSNSYEGSRKCCLTGASTSPEAWAVPVIPAPSRSKPSGSYGS